MRFLLLSLLSMTAAHAATLNVPDTHSTIALAVQAAADGDTILVRSDAPFRLHVIEDTIDINKNLTIRAENPPREINDADITDDVVIWVDLDEATVNPGFLGAFNVRRNFSLTLENLYFKQHEMLCNDRLDNDGNGLTDADDPSCESTSGDTAATPPVSLDGAFFGDARAVYVNLDANLTIRNCIMQGWSIGVEGNVIYADRAASVTIENSQFVNNLGLLEVLASGGYSRSRGIIYAAATTLTISNTYFEKNWQRYGGAIFATAGSIVLLEDNEFHANRAEDGGAVHVESSILFADRNQFVSNSASLVPGGQLYVEYEGGAIYAEDSSVELRNNVFLNNDSLDWASSVMLRRNFGGSGSAPVVENNTFVANSANLIGGASVMVDDTTVRYVNNISYFEGNGIVGAQNWILGTIPTVQYNNFYGVELGDIFTADLSGVAIEQVTNIFTDPNFANYSGEHDDWRLWRFWLDPLSPAVDAGDPAILDVGGSRSDMGAYGGNNTGATDADGDGWTNIYDCNDNDATVKPYAFEACDDLDNDCNGIVDDREIVYYVDRDFDGYGTDDDPEDVFELCPGDVAPQFGAGILVTQKGDCVDDNNLINPGRTEFCDGLDNDCDDQVDEDIPLRTHYIDQDLDGFGDPDPRFTIDVQCPPEGYSPFPSDCNDADDTIHPLVDAEARSHLPLANAPLERHEADRNPAYVADGIDQDCDLVDLCFPDLDGDGFGAAPLPGREPQYVLDNDRNCRNLSSFTAVNDLDCDDGDPLSFPGGEEIPGDGLDQNCDGKETCFEDLDGDGFGTLTPATDDDLDCDNDSAPTSSNSDDCDDSEATGAGNNPLAAEICDGFDNDCDGVIDEVTDPSSKTFYRDADGDGWGAVDQEIRACGEPVGYTEQSGDCDDLEPRAYPTNNEQCDGIDNNCEAGIDEDDAIDVVNWYEDLDGDGYGNSELVQRQCAAPADGGPWIKAGKPLDCNDSDPAVGPCITCGDCSNMGPGGSVPFVLSLLSIGMLRRRRRSA